MARTNFKALERANVGSRGDRPVPLDAYVGADLTHSVCNQV